MGESHTVETLWEMVGEPGQSIAASTPLATMRAMIRRYRLEVVIVVAIVVMAGLLARWSAIPPFPDRQVTASEERYQYEVGEPSDWFSAWSVGDGQAYALIAIDPTGKKLGNEIQRARYRFTRAGFGWVTWAASLGRAAAVPYALAAVSAASVIGVLVIAVRMRPRLGAKTWLLTLNPALFLGFSADTAEPLGILLLSVALAWNSWIAAVLLGVTRPSFLVAVWGRWRLFIPGAASAMALAVYSLLVFTDDRGSVPGGVVEFPFTSYLEHPSIAGMALGVAALATVGVGVRSKDWSWMLAGLFVLCFGTLVLEVPANAWRAAGFLPVLWAFGPRYQTPIRRDNPLQRKAQPADVG